MVQTASPIVHHQAPLIVCVCDYWQRRHYYMPQTEVQPGGDCDDRNSWNGWDKEKAVRRLPLQVDAISGNYWLRELLQQRELRRRLQHEHGVRLLWLALQPPERDTIDYKWADMLAHTIWEHIEVEHLMSWLSTLGGGFSALGEQFERCAETAGKISLQQLTIGLRVGDPFLQARCKLYYSISLIQRGQLRQAKHLIRRQYQFAVKHKEHDQRLLRMCLGIWLRLRFEYEERRKRHQAGLLDS
ncbi:hypothetical protein KR222_009014 [Zaprionus bogoriensis]|nr:hypothetical protein KR222_009014 [Zaprionus bogoriensis]